MVTPLVVLDAGYDGERDEVLHAYHWCAGVEAQWVTEEGAEHQATRRRDPDVAASATTRDLSCCCKGCPCRKVLGEGRVSVQGSNC